MIRLTTPTNLTVRSVVSFQTRSPAVLPVTSRLAVQLHESRAGGLVQTDSPLEGSCSNEEFDKHPATSKRR